MAKRALIIRHAEPETLAGNYTSALEERGFELHALNVFEGAPGFEAFEAPPLEDVDLIVALGGPQSANDCYPALREERRLMTDAMASGVPVFGVCLGAQLMARVLGGEVAPTGGYEFGLRKIWITEGRKPATRCSASCAFPWCRRSTASALPSRPAPYGAGFRVHALPGRHVQEAEPRIPLRRLVRIPVRATAHSGRASGLESGSWQRTTS